MGDSVTDNAERKRPGVKEDMKCDAVCTEFKRDIPGPHCGRDGRSKVSPEMATTTSEIMVPYSRGGRGSGLMPWGSQCFIS